MTCLLQQTTGIEDKIHEIFQVSLSHKETADILVAYCECTWRTIPKSKYKPFRPRKAGKKKLELMNDENAFETTHHHPGDLSPQEDQLDTHNNNAPSKEWPFQWNLHTQYHFAEHDLDSLTWA